MPTVGIYVGMPVARTVAERWQVTVGEEDFQEVIRSICAEALDVAAGISHTQKEFSEHCPGAHLHKFGHRCRTCGGS